MSNPQKAKGSAFENLIAKGLRPHLGQHIGRGVAGATLDKGDISGIPNWVLECKNYTSMPAAISAGLRDLPREMLNAGARFGAVIVKRRGTTDWRKQLVVMEMGTFVEVLKETSGLDRRLLTVDL